MFLSNANIELLRLAGWCKNLPTGMYDRFQTQVLHSAEIATLEGMQLVGTTRNKKSMRLKPGGRKLLLKLGYDYPQDAKYVSDYTRRLEASEILLTFYRAGCNVFVDRREDLAASQVFLTKMAVRRNKERWGDLFAGERFSGIGCIRRQAMLCHYVTEDAEGAGMYYSKERRTLSSIASLYGYSMAMIYAGSSYLGVAQVLRNKAMTQGERKNDSIPYAEVYKRTVSPLYLLECSDTGALQLLIISQENYRERLSRFLFHASPPPQEIPSADGLLIQENGGGQQWVCVLAVDMDVKRLDRVLGQVLKTQNTSLFIAGLLGQQKALHYLYGKHRNVRVAPIKQETLTQAFGQLLLYEPVSAAYMDDKGGMLDASNLPMD